MLQSAVPIVKHFKIMLGLLSLLISLFALSINSDTSKCKKKKKKTIGVLSRPAFPHCFHAMWNSPHNKAIFHNSWQRHCLAFIQFTACDLLLTVLASLAQRVALFEPQMMMILFSLHSEYPHNAFVTGFKTNYQHDQRNSCNFHCVKMVTLAMPFIIRAFCIKATAIRLFSSSFSAMFAHT